MNDYAQVDHQAIQQLLQAQQTAQQEHKVEVNEIIKMGESEFGTARFGEMGADIAKALGGDAATVGGFMALVRKADNPTRLIAYLADHPDEVERFTKMPAARVETALRTIEARWAPNGHLSTNPEPEWKTVARKGGALSEKDFWSPASDLLDDKAYDRHFEKYMQKRMGRR